MPIISANGIAHHVATDGPAGGPPVLLVHGLGWDHTLWSGQIETLAMAGFRVVAPDLRGMGESDKPDMPYSIGLYADDMLALMRALGIGRFAVAGFSLGGMVAAAMLARAPERIAAAVLACCALHSTPEGEAATEAMLARSATLGTLPFACEQAAMIWHPDFVAGDPDTVERFVAWRAAMDQDALRRAFRAAYGVDCRASLAAVDLPVRFIAADEDPFASVAVMADLQARVRGSDLAVIETSGHMAPIERRDEFDAALLEFLAKAWPVLSG